MREVYEIKVICKDEEEGKRLKEICRTYRAYCSFECNILSLDGADFEGNLYRVIAKNAGTLKAIRFRFDKD